uniref:Peptidase M13 N-terminal domain-containing protein n=1 Tax=Strigamia maritima TaxID=126957 RepID=T1IUV5_STRMM
MNGARWHIGTDENIENNMIELHCIWISSYSCNIILVVNYVRQIYFPSIQVVFTRLLHLKMTKYKRTDFEEDDLASSNGSTAAEIPSLGRTHIRYRSGYDLWTSRTKIEKIFIIILGCLSLLVIILAIIIGSHHHDKPIKYKFVHFTQENNQTDSNLCLTKQCVTVASALLNSMDASIHACEDFYQYSCGGWIKKNPIPEGRSFWGIFDQLWQENQLVMKNVLESKLNSKSSKAEYKAQVYYNSCMDANNTIAKLGAKPLLDVIEKVCFK